MRVLWLVNFSGRIRAPVAYFLAPFLGILVFFCWFNALGWAPGLGHKKKKKFQNIPQNQLVGKYFYHHDGHILKKWRNTSILAEIALEVDHSQTSKLFSPTYTGVFSVQDSFSPGISSQDILPPQNQSARYFLLKSPVPLSPFPSKVEWSAP